MHEVIIKNNKYARTRTKKSSMKAFAPHILFFSQIEFFKNAQKPHKNVVKTDCIYFDRKFWH